MTRTDKLAINIIAIVLLVLSSASKWTTDPTVIHYAAVALALINVGLHQFPDIEKQLPKIESVDERKKIVGPSDGRFSRK